MAITEDQIQPIWLSWKQFLQAFYTEHPYLKSFQVC